MTPTKGVLHINFISYNLNHAGYFFCDKNNSCAVVNQFTTVLLSRNVEDSQEFMSDKRAGDNPLSLIKKIFRKFVMQLF